MTREQNETMQRVRNVGVVFWTIIGGIILAYCALLAVSRVGSVLTPFLLAMLIVYILRPVVNFLEDRGVPRGWALVITYIAAVVVVTVVLVFLIPVLAVQVQAFIRNFPFYFKSAQVTLLRYQGLWKQVRLDANAARIIDSGLAKAQEAGVAIISNIPNYTLSAFSLIVNIVLAPLIAFYLLKDLREIRETMLAIVPKRRRAEMVHLMHEVDEVLAGFLRGQSLVALSVAVLSTVALLVLRVDYAVVIGLITGLLSVIPYFGPVVGALIAGIVALFKSPVLALLAIGILIAIQQVANVSIAPYIMSQQVNVHPVVVILALLLGGSLFGVIGLVLAIPIAAIAKAVFIHFAEGHHADYQEAIRGAAEEGT